MRKKELLSTWCKQLVIEISSTEKKVKITIEKISTVVKEGNTYYYIQSKDGKKYFTSIKTSNMLPFVSSGDTLEIGFYETTDDIIEIKKIYQES